MPFRALCDLPNQKRADRLMRAIVRTHPELLPFLMTGIDVERSYPGNPNYEHPGRVGPRGSSPIKRYAVFYDYDAALAAWEQRRETHHAHPQDSRDLLIFCRGFDAAR